MARKLWMPPTDVDLVSHLVFVPDPSIGDPEGRGISRADPRHLRLYVAAWMLAGPHGDFDAALIEAFALYDGSGTGLLDQPRMLTTADIVAEVLQLTSEGET